MTLPLRYREVADDKMDSLRARRQDRHRHAGGRYHRGSRRRYVRRSETDRRDDEALRRSGADAVRSIENDLPVEQLPPARGQERFQGTERAALVPEGAEFLLARQPPNRAPGDLCRKDHLRGRAWRRHRQEMLQHLGGRGRRLYLRLYLRERRHGRRPACARTSRSNNGRGRKASTPSVCSVL